MGYRLRDANSDDFEALTLFLDEFLRTDYFIPHRQLREILTCRYHRTLFAGDSGRILGVAILTKSSRTLVNLLVDPCERKRGIASALLLRLRVEIIRVKTNVTAGNPTDFYLKRGFRISPQKTGKQHIVLAVRDLDSPFWARH